MIRPALFAILFLLASCAERKPLPKLGEVPRFQLTDQKGELFDSKGLAGQVWIADFIFTTCQGPCPRMTSRLKAIQTATTDAGLSAVKLLSFTVDPETDTPPILAAYAKKFGANEQRWTFLTGERSVLNDLGLNAFKLGAVAAGMDHSTRFVLLDKQSRIRGYYGLTQEDMVAKIVKDAARLEEETE